MITSPPTNKHRFVYTAKLPENQQIILGLYSILKTKAALKQVPFLPANDSRRNIIRKTTVKSPYVLWKEQLTEQLRTLTSPFFKKAV
ncbi:MAG: hypothetical protein ABI861_06235 [Panacibacter sp.]